MAITKTLALATLDTIKTRAAEDVIYFSENTRAEIKAKANLDKLPHGFATPTRGMFLSEFFKPFFDGEVYVDGSELVHNDKTLIYDFRMFTIGRIANKLGIDLTNADNRTVELKQYKAALDKLLTAIHHDEKEGGYFICPEASDLIDRCTALVDGKLRDINEDFSEF